MWILNTPTGEPVSRLGGLPTSHIGLRSTDGNENRPSLACARMDLVRSGRLLLLLLLLLLLGFRHICRLLSLVRLSLPYNLGSNVAPCIKTHSNPVKQKDRCRRNDRRLCSLDPLPKPPFYLSVIVQVDQNRSTTQIERCNGTVSRAGKDMYNDIAEVGVLLDEIPVKPERKGPPREVFHI